MESVVFEDSASVDWGIRGSITEAIAPPDPDSRRGFNRGSDAASDRCTDECLIRQHIEGCRDSFTVLVRRYERPLHGFLRRRVRPGTAEDATQETFLKVLGAARSFDPRQQFRAWLYTVAANTARDRLRTHYRPGGGVGHGAGDAEDTGSAARANRRARAVPSPAPAPADVAAAGEDKDRVRSAVDRLPENLRRIVRLSYFDKLSYQEISELLDIPLGTVKSRLHAAVRSFADEWICALQRTCERGRVRGAAGRSRVPRPRRIGKSSR